MPKQNKFYVVWKGRQRGIYSSWKECSARVSGFTGARFMAFESRALAEQALAGRYEDYRNGSSRAVKLSRADGDAPAPDSIAVDASCRGNPGPMEYRGVMIGKGREVFRPAPVKHGTNNIGEFLAIVHALEYLKEHGLDWPVYSDSGHPLGEAKTLQYKNRAVGGDARGIRAHRPGRSLAARECLRQRRAEVENGKVGGKPGGF
jgi:ribonuclease HI